MPFKKNNKHSKISSKSRTPLPLFPIVGIGASAGGLEALGQFLPKLPQDTGMAFVIIQHLDPTHESMTAEILTRKTRLPVTEVKDGMPVEPNHIYVIPPNHNLAIVHGVLRLLTRTETRGQHLPINFFFQSLAEDLKNKSIGVILSGTASDGTMGLESIKAEGGVTIAQDPQTAKYDGMPRSAISSGVVDLVLSPAQIAAELDRMARHPLLVRRESKPAGNARVEAKQEGDVLARIFVLIRNQSHVDFAQYKLTTIKRRIARRMVLNKTATIEDYLEYLRKTPEEVKFLFADLLINVTSFFRDPEAFAALKTEVFPEMLKNKVPDSPLRIWVVGCASGEEAYSLAISLLEYLGDKATQTPIQIFATCISETMIQKARAGEYSESINQTVSKDRLQRFFSKTDTGYKISKSIRDMCLFSRHDVTRDAPFAKLDLISCRNLLIYFDSALQKRVLPILHYALNPGGFLWLGRAETVGDLSALFSLIDKTNKIFVRKTTRAAMKFHFPAASYVPEQLEPLKKSSERNHLIPDVQRERDRIFLSAYAPPSVVVNEEMDIILTGGDTTPYLMLPVGQPSTNLLKMMRKELAADLRMTVQSVKKRNTPARKDGLSLSNGGRLTKFNINVVPITTSPQSKTRHFLICFEPAPLLLAESEKVATPSSRSRKRHASANARQVEDLKRELEEAKNYQQTLASDFEAAQEELTAGNEELQSTNEELQSTNEELETAKEELQSTNEELTTVNDELQSRNVDLVQLGNDLINFVGATDIPIITVGLDCRIRRFTPKAGRMMNLIQTDVGRPIGDIKPNFAVLDLHTLVSEVIETIIPKEIEVQDRDGHWFRFQIKPYKTSENKIDGAIIAMVDIDLLKRHLTESIAALDYANSVADAAESPLVVIDSQLRMQSANRAFREAFGNLPKDAEKDFLAFIGGDTFITTLRSGLTETLEGRTGLKDFKIDNVFPKLGRRKLLINARKIKWVGEAPSAVLLSIEDVTESQKLKQALEASEKNFRNLINTAHDCIFCVNQAGKITLANKRMTEIFGYESGELIGKPLDALIPERFRALHSRFHAEYKVNPHPRPMGAGLALFALRKDGIEFPVDVSLSPSQTDEGPMVMAMVRDITERKAIERERDLLLVKEQEARTNAERANLTKDQFLATLSHELRTPMTTILAYGQLIQRAKISPEKFKHGIDTIVKSAKNQSQLIDDLLDVSRIQSGKLLLKFAEVDPSEIVRLAIESVRIMAESKPVTIETDFKQESGKVWVDPGRLQQVIWNLLTNAIKFSSPRGVVQVRTNVVEENSDRWCSIQILDHGKGIATDFLPHLFHRFSQADSSSTRHHDGLGLGLSIVSDLLKMIGGTVRAESDGLGKGSTFTVLLPLKSPASRVESTSQKAGLAKLQLDEDLPPDLRDLRVLIVDDEPGSLEAMNDTLCAFGATTVPCSSATEALAALEKQIPDVLISDIAMPGEDGYTLITKIRKLGSDAGGDVPALALTAYASDEDVKRTELAGFQMHLAKPFDTFRLGHAVASLAKQGKS